MHDRKSLLCPVVTVAGAVQQLHRQRVRTDRADPREPSLDLPRAPRVPGMEPGLRRRRLSLRLSPGGERMPSARERLPDASGERKETAWQSRWRYCGAICSSTAAATAAGHELTKDFDELAMMRGWSGDIANVSRRSAPRPIARVAAVGGRHPSTASQCSRS